MKLDPRLYKLAAISPKEFAAKILERNRSLRNSLLRLKPYLGKSFDAMPGYKLAGIMRITEIGCPHCMAALSCGACDWSKIDRRGLCHDIKFGKCTLSEMQSQRNVAVSYGPESEYIRLDYTSDYSKVTPYLLIDRTEWTRCMEFVDAHIQWAQLKSWGKQNKEQVP